MSRQKIFFLILVVAIIIGIIWSLPDDFLTLQNLKAHRTDILAYRDANPILSVMIFCAVYILFTTLSLPGAALMTLLGGAIFGLVFGTIWVSISSTIGATLAFLISRYFFKESVKTKFGDKIKTIEENFAKDGAFYLFSLRLVPVIPFFVINLLMGLTPIKTHIYALASWAGMLAGTIVYVNAGTQLAKLESLKGILSPTIILSFILLAAFPFIARKLLNLMRKQTT